MSEPPLAGAPGENPSVTATLVDRCREGDEVAFTLVYQQHASRLHRHLHGLLGARGEAEDALQQTFLEAFRNIHRFEKRAKLSTWLHGIAVRVALNVIRSQRRRTRVASALVSGSVAAQRRPTSPESQIARRQEIDRLRRHLSDVAPDSQAAFILYYVEQLELGDVAAQLGMTPGAAWARIKRARERVLESMLHEQQQSEEAPS